MDGRHVFLFLVVSVFSLAVAAPVVQAQDYPTTNLSTLWVNGPNIRHTITYPDGSLIKALLLKGSTRYYGPSFACGFYCRSATPSPCVSFVFAIFIVYTNSGAGITLLNMGIPHVVWTANRKRSVKENATLELTREGDLVLKDVDGTLVWSTGTAGKSVVGMNITDAGNLVLVDQNNLAVWQSFDHPTDSLLPGQKLLEGQRLTANTSTTNLTQGQLYLAATFSGWDAFVDSSPPQLYYSYGSNSVSAGKDPAYVMFLNGSIDFYANSSTPNNANLRITFPPALIQYLRLEFDGHLRVYAWNDTNGWIIAKDVFDFYQGDCAYPTVCGDYGLCLNGQCSCPQNKTGGEVYLKQVNDRQPNLGCSLITPLSCQSSQSQNFLVLEDVSYFNYFERTLLFSNLTTEESCMEACRTNCSCKAALFQYGINVSQGSCYLPTEIFSLMGNVQDVSHYNSTAYIKVQIPQTSASPTASGQPGSLPSSGKKSTPVPTIVGSVVGAFLGLFLLLGILIAILRKIKGKDDDVEEEDHFDQLPGMPTRFSYEELRVATDNFSIKLGQGGFGSVYKGVLTDDTGIAVKQLDGIGQGKREFLSEVQTIGSVHHVNLVRLVGFCAERLHKLLVYEYMSNGSLEKWIFKNDSDHELNWQIKRKILNDVAKGLQYLHEECRQRIAHLDIKPQNILLDENFNAKVSDFGLSKLIDRDQSSVMTTMRGTPGYLAPEWLTSFITEKADVYSFGVVIVEILCGRKNLDHSQPQESVHLLMVLKEMGEQGRISDFIEKFCHNTKVNEKEANEMLHLAIWCLQHDTIKRPPMSSVVKVLEGTLEVDPDLDYNFLNVTHKVEFEPSNSNASAPLLASILSGPR